MLMLPEIVVIVTAFAVLFLDLVLPEQKRTMLGPLAAAGLVLAFSALLVTPASGALFGGRFSMDPVAWWFKLLFILSALITVLISLDVFDGRTGVRMPGIGFRGEYYAVLLFAITGMMYLISARDIILLYVSLELATIPLFALAAWRRDDVQSGEAGLKYVVLGAISSALLVYGLGILYGLTGTTDLDGIRRGLSEVPQPAFWLAVSFIMAGMGFKFTLVPFHIWAADVYQGAPTPVTAFLSVASKSAGLALLFQLFYRVMVGWLDDWTLLIAIMAAATMTLGNCVAIVQQNIKRFMAFSAISQAGYFLMGFLGPADQGVPAMIFYMLVYVVTNLAAFACIIWYENETGRLRIDEYRGLSITNPLMSLALMVALFSLAGIPPLSGFVGKFFLFNIASKAGCNWLVAVAAVNSTISLYYYLRVIRQMYIEPPYPEARRIPVNQKVVATVLALSIALSLMGIIPSFYERINLDTLTWLATLK